jgi:tellurite resistance protein TerC
VFLMLFTFFGVAPTLQRRALIIGVVGAIILRAVMIFIGAILIAKFHWILYVFGLFLLFTGLKMMMFAESESNLEHNPILAWIRGHLRITSEHHGERFVIVKDGQRWFTPLFVVVAMIGITDVIFAVDSIPAIFAVTKDPFIVYTSNVFAILGLRSLYFALAGVMDKFHYLKIGLGVVLSFVGVKMILAHTAWKIDTLVSLGVIVAILTVSVVWSLVKPKRVATATGKAGSPLPADGGTSVPASRLISCLAPPKAARTE